MTNQGITYNPEVASIAQQLVAQNQPIDSVINHVGPGASLTALVNAFKQAQDRARQEQIQGAKQAGNEGSGLAGMMPQNKTVADEVYASLQQGQAPQQEPTAMMAHGGLANLPSYNFMPHNYEHGGIVAFNGKDGDQEVEEGATPERLAKAAAVPATAYGIKKLLDSKIAERTAQGARASAATLVDQGNGYRGADIPNNPTTAAERARALGGAAEKGIKASRLSPVFPKTIGAAAYPAAALYGAAYNGLTTTTPEYEERFGFEKSDNPLKQLLVRGLGVSSDLGNAMTFGMAGDLFRDKQNKQAAEKRPPATPAAVSPPPTPTPEAPADISKYFAATGSAGGAGAGAGGYGDNPALMKSRDDLMEAFKARVREANPGKQEDLDASTKARYDKAGIGKAAEAEQARIAKREAGLGEESKAAFYRDLSKAGFNMAAFAGKRGREATGFLGALAAGGQDFAESNIKTAARFNELKENLADKQAALAQAQENVKLGVLKESSAKFENREKAYDTAQDKVLGYRANMTEEDIKAGRAFRVAQMQIGAANARDNNKSEEQIKRAMIAAKNDPKALERLSGILANMNPIMYGAGLRADAVAAGSEQKNLTAFNKDINVQMIRRQLSDPNITAQKQQALQAQLKQYADNYKISSSGMPGGGASANRLTTDANGMLIYNPQQPIE